MCHQRIYVHGQLLRWPYKLAYFGVTWLDVRVMAS